MLITGQDQTVQEPPRKNLFCNTGEQGGDREGAMCCVNGVSPWRRLRIRGAAPRVGIWRMWSLTRGNGFASAGRFQGGAQVGTESHRGRTALSLRGRSQVGLERDRREEFRY